ncbi:flagellin N-terminal helical domain-containing protein [Rossellomorea marisflavi]|uniref:flagellin N-terminal helical domain-containing protein n=1 Tax=Rossellomorea marisflavi TaxID=189381 RepID=UPI003FA0033F
MIINNNAVANNTYNQLQKNQTQVQKSMEKLSSGLRINKAGDDAAGLAISEKMRSQIRGLDQATRNAQDGISLIQTAEGGLSVGQDMLQRVKELAVQASSETYDASDTKNIQAEIDELLTEIDKTAGNMDFNGKKLLDGTADIKIAVGANAESLDITIGSMKTDDLGDDTNKLSSFKTGGANEVTDRDSAQLLVASVEEAIKGVSSERASLGAKQNRMEYTIQNLQTTSENLQSAESRIRDADVAKEMVKVSKNQILQQASQAMLVQANQSPQQVLQLLR